MIPIQIQDDALLPVQLWRDLIYTRALYHAMCDSTQELCTSERRINSKELGLGKSHNGKSSEDHGNEPTIALADAASKSTMRHRMTELAA